MKKLSYLFVVILSLVGVSNVKADTINFDYSYSPSIYFTEEQTVSFLEEKIDTLIDYWEEHYSNDYPYYYVGIDNVIYGEKRLDAYLHYSKNFNSPNPRYFGNDTFNTNVNSGEGEEHALAISVYCNYQSNEQDNCHYNIVDIPSTASWYFNPIFYSLSSSGTTNYYYDPLTFYTSNFDWHFTKQDIFNVLKDNKVLFSLNYGDIIPTYKDLFVDPNHYTEINLNDYAYIALSLKNYNHENAFSTNIYTKGQLCLTPVYDYGMKEKSSYKDYSNGYQVDRCTPVYDDFTPVRTTILKSDLENHAIYYVKAYNTSIENKIKVDSSIFDITYITGENADNPNVSINGRSYPTIPYSDLSSTSTKSEDEDYISGYSENITNYFDFSSIISSPIKALESVWSAITSILVLISTFIALLPATMQAFLYASFALAIVLGIIKILL